MKKKNNTNEFLVNKKNPLTMPPDFEKLPKPSDEEIIEDEYEKFDNEYVPEEESYSDVKDLL